MKKLIIIFAVTQFVSQLVRAQGTLYLSNLGQTPTGSNSVGSDSWIASSIMTGPNTTGYTLDSIQLGLTSATSEPSGFTVMLYNAVIVAGANPGTSLGTLDGSANPSTAGIYNYTPDSSLTLSHDTIYFIVLTAGTTVANGAYGWSLTVPNSYNPSGGWRAGGIWTSSNGSTWLYNSGSPQFAITATAVPEPSASWLFFLGCGVWIYVRTRKPHAATTARNPQ